MAVVKAQAAQNGAATAADQSKVAFVVGAGRSGTTLLYKLLCLHSQVAYISNLENRFPRLHPALSGLLRAQHVDAKLRGWFSAGSNAYHISRSVYQRLSPAPVEGEKIYQRFGIPLIPAADFRLGSEQTKAFRTYIDQVTRASRCTTFVSKRTANNRRIQILSQVFPDARFVNLVRDGREVAASLGHVDWWNDHVMWWDRDRRTPAQAAAQGESMAFLCAKNWVEEIRVIRSGLESVNPQQILNVRYENLVSEPVREMTKVLSFLGLWPQRDYEQALERLKFPYRPRKWAGFWNPQDYNVVLDTQRSELEQLQYTL